VFSLAFSIGIIVIGLSFAGSWGFLSAPFLCCLGAGAVLLYVFIRHELHTKSPVMNLGLFRSKTFSMANGVCLTSYLVQQMITYLLTFYLISVMGLKSNIAGFILLASPVVMMVFSPIGGSMADRKGTRLPAGVGVALICAGCLVMSFLAETSPFYMVIGALLLVGSGCGLSVSSINAAILGAAPKEHAGVASGMLATMRNFGQTMGVVCGSLILALRQPAFQGLAGQGAYLYAQRDTFYFGIAVLAVSLALIVLLPAQRPQ